MVFFFSELNALQECPLRQSRNSRRRESAAVHDETENDVSVGEIMKVTKLMKAGKLWNIWRSVKLANGGGEYSSAPAVIPR
ncbi:hypothetical protein EVAR_64431_1 [Eumeta japonica]|uniref:Uncharacterized protein n=1 Tax=Eumeta variegata TaxID=151549 RepID=A0A4C1ZH78_EUMVA|nr:hypothetical protein EVAR_64431_1 [Eumeta japonica]